MILKFFIAFILATAGIVLGYLDYIPSFISLGICIISFVGALMFAIKEFLDVFNAAHKKNDETIQNLILSIQGEVKDDLNALIVNQTENFANLNTNLTRNKDSIVIVVKEITETYIHIVDSLKALESVINNNIATSENLTSKLDIFNSNSERLSTEIKSHLNTFSSNSEKISTELKSHLDTFNLNSKKMSDNLQVHLDSSVSSVNNILKDFRNKTNDLNANLKEFCVTIESFSREVKELNENHCNLASEISNASNSNKRIIEKLEEKIEEFLDNEAELFQQSNNELSDTIESQISNITNSIKSLTSSMHSDIRSLTLDVKDLYDAVTAINNKTQDIDKADKILLEQISKICK